MNSRIRLAATLCALTVVTPLYAQRPTDVVKWTVKAPTAALKPGVATGVELTAEVEPGWHLYALTQPKGGPAELSIAPAKGKPFNIKVRDIAAPAPRVERDLNFSLDTHQYEGKVVFTLPVVARRHAASGKQSLPLEITFQACGNGICLRPFTQTVPLDVTVAGASR
jgi:hypothetical protein